MTDQADIVLASGSQIRAQMLQNAGVRVEILPARIDEDSLKAALAAEGASVRDTVDTLAEYKSRKIAGRLPGARVLGSDQILVHKGKIFDKPRTLEEATAHLRQFRGATHELLSAAVIYENGKPVWREIGRAQMIMHDLSDAKIDAYVARHGDDLLTTVGAYKIESGGAWLFSRIQGDYFSVLGMPLLGVLAFLRSRGVEPI